MTGLLLFVHILGAILAIGPVAIAASMFPPAARAAHAQPPAPARGAVTATLHRITRVYAVIGIIVPVAGLALGVRLGVLGQAWLLVSMALTAGAAVVLILGILPRQKRLLPAGPGPNATMATDDVDRTSKQLAMHTGIFNVLWVIVLALMVYRPDSTAGA